MSRKSSWSDEDRERLIDLVSKNPILWQNDLPDHMRTDKNDDVWHGIGKVMGKASGNVLGNILGTRKSDLQRELVEHCCSLM